MPAGRPPAYRGSLAGLVPQDESKAFDMYALVAGVVDEDSFFEVKPDFAKEVICGLARLDGRPVGVVANQPAHKGGVLFVDSSDKVARFVWLCDAFNIPLIFLADVPGFMIGSAVERQGIIRHGAKLITAVSEATVPKFCVVVRKAYGAGLYAMAGPGCPAPPARASRRSDGVRRAAARRPRGHRHAEPAGGAERAVRGDGSRGGGRGPHRRQRPGRVGHGAGRRGREGLLRRRGPE